MNIDIEQRLRESAGTVHMSRPVEDILVRGDRLRRRRTRGITAGLGAAAAVIALAVSMALPPGSNPVITPAVASWSGGATNLTEDELHELSNTCLANQDGPGQLGIPESSLIPDGTMPIAAEARDAVVLAYFRDGTTSLECRAKLGPDGGINSAGGLLTDRYTPIPEGSHLGTMGFGYRDPGIEGGPVTELYDVTDVSKQVARVTAEVAGETYEGNVVDGIVFFWISDHFSAEVVNAAVFTAYDDEGHVLERVDGLTRANDPQGPNDDKHL